MSKHDLVIKRSLSSRDWCMVRRGYNPEAAAHEATMFTLGNGYFASRGVLEFADQDGEPGQFFNGVMDHTIITIETLVNMPKVFDLEVRCEGVRLDPGIAKRHTLRRTLDMKQGILHTLFVFTDREGRRTRYESFRLVHRGDRHKALLWGSVTAENWEGVLELSGGIDAGVTNKVRSQGVTIQHFKLQALEERNGCVVCEGGTLHTGLSFTLQTRLECGGRGRPFLERMGDRLRQVHRVRVKKGSSVPFVKRIALAGKTVDQRSASELALAAMRELRRENLDRLLDSHVAAWGKIWEQSDVEVKGCVDDQCAIRFNIFHLTQCVDYATDLDVSIGAKGLHGQGYNGHAYWDTEVFMLPFFVATAPEAARLLLLYRVRRLQAARDLARSRGWTGALFPWESGLQGNEVNPCWPWDLCHNILQPKPHANTQFHVNADIAWGVMQYCIQTGDEDFFLDHGAQLLMETAQFWKSFVRYDSKRKGYVLAGVQCPDEYHSGVDNDAYTNGMAAANLRWGAMAAERLRAKRPARFQEICRETGLTPKKIALWSRIADQIVFNLNPKTKLIEQFDGYFKLRDVKVGFDEHGWPCLPKGMKHGEWRFTQIIKQADVVLLMFMLEDQFDRATRRANFRYYEARDHQGSSLSPNTYAIAGMAVGERERAYRSFRVSANRDIRWTKEGGAGIHAACMGGTWMSAVYGFAGLRASEEGLRIQPWLPDGWQSLVFRYQWRGSLVRVVIARKSVSVDVEEGGAVPVEVKGVRRMVRLGERLQWACASAYS